MSAPVSPKKVIYLYPDGPLQVQAEATFDTLKKAIDNTLKKAIDKLEKRLVGSKQLESPFDKGGVLDESETEEVLACFCYGDDLSESLSEKISASSPWREIPFFSLSGNQTALADNWFSMLPTKTASARFFASMIVEDVDIQREQGNKSDGIKVKYYFQLEHDDNRERFFNENMRFLLPESELTPVPTPKVESLSGFLAALGKVDKEPDVTYVAFFGYPKTEEDKSKQDLYLHCLESMHDKYPNATLVIDSNLPMARKEKGKGKGTDGSVEIIIPALKRDEGMSAKYSCGQDFFDKILLTALEIIDGWYREIITGWYREKNGTSDLLTWLKDQRFYPSKWGELSFKQRSGKSQWYLCHPLYVRKGSLDLNTVKMTPDDPYTYEMDFRNAAPFSSVEFAKHIQEFNESLAQKTKNFFSVAANLFSIEGFIREIFEKQLATTWTDFYPQYCFFIFSPFSPETLIFPESDNVLDRSDLRIVLDLFRNIHEKYKAVSTAGKIFQISVGDLDGENNDTSRLYFREKPEKNEKSEKNAKPFLLFHDEINRAAENPKLEYTFVPAFSEKGSEVFETLNSETFGTLKKLADRKKRGYLYLFVNNTSETTDHCSGTIIFSKSKKKSFELKLLALVLSRVVYILQSMLFKKQLLSKSTQSAVGSIMSRNGSHNIGSHVLSALSHQVGTMPDDRILYQYIQQRMDYIATVTTDFPNWTVPTRFVVNLMKTFLSQRHLLEHISESEGLGAWLFHGRHTGVEQTSKIKIHVRKKAGDGKVLADFITYPDDKSKSEASPTTDPLNDDARLAIPGGTVGQHAFYTILENIIRNAAKHGWSKRSGGAKETNLEIYIDFLDEQGSESVVFTIWDNMSDVFAPLSPGSDGSCRLNASVLQALRDGLKQELDVRSPAASRRQAESAETPDTAKIPKMLDTPPDIEKANRGGAGAPKAVSEDLKETDDPERKRTIAVLNAAYADKQKLEEKRSRLHRDNVTREDLLDELTPAQTKKLLEASSPKPAKDGSVKTPVDLGKDLPRHWAQQVRLGQPLITDQGELRRENWGLAEMRISAGYLQRRSLGEIGGIDEDKAKTGIITPVAVKDESGEIYHLGYRFTVPKPKKILIVDPDEGWSIPREQENVLKKDGIHIKTVKEINGEDRNSDGYSELDYEYVVMPKSKEALLAKWLPLRAAGERQTPSPDDDPFEKWLFPFRLLLAGEKGSEKKLADDVVDYAELKRIIESGGPSPDKDKVDKIKKLVFGAWLAKLKKIVEPQKADAAKDVIYLQIQTGSSASGGGKGLMRDSDLYRIVFRECGHSILLEATKEQRNKTARLLTTLLASVPMDRESFPQAAIGGESRECIREQLAGFCDLFKRELRLNSRTGIGVNQDFINCLKALYEGSDAVIPADNRFSGFERAFLRNLQLDLQGDNSLAKNRVKALIRHLVETDRERLNAALDVFCGTRDRSEIQSPDSGSGNTFDGSSDPSSMLRKNIDLLFRPADSDLSAEFDKLVDKLNSAYQTSDVFLRKYEEDISTLPPFYRERPQGKAKPDGTVTLDNVELAKSDSPADRTIRYVRHDNTAGGLYAEALSGSQSYLNALAKFDLTNLNFTVRLVENALLRVLLVDERVCNFFATRPEELDACKKMRIFVADVSMADAQQPPRPGFVKLNKDDETAFGIPAERSYDILIIHQGIIDKWCSAHDKTVVGTLLKNLGQRVPFVVVTTGRGRPDNIPDDARVLPFTSVESTIFRKYPEKLVLVNTVMNILPTGEGAES